MKKAWIAAKYLKVISVAVEEYQISASNDRAADYKMKSNLCCTSFSSSMRFFAVCVIVRAWSDRHDEHHCCPSRLDIRPHAFVYTNTLCVSVHGRKCARKIVLCEASVVRSEKNADELFMCARQCVQIRFKRQKQRIQRTTTSNEKWVKVENLNGILERVRSRCVLY